MDEMKKMLEILEDLRGTKVEFRPLDSNDWDAFAGADEGSLLTYGEKFAFILSPDGRLAAIENETGDEHDIAFA